jgi:hypothetical protein
MHRIPIVATSARLALSSACKSNAKMILGTKQILIASYSSSRSILASTYQDPPYMVDVQGPGASNKHSTPVKVLILTPKEKKEMYDLHKQNPEEHTVSALAIQFKCREDRVNAVLTLQRMREETFEKLGVNNPEWAVVHAAYCNHFDLYKSQKDTERTKALAENPPVVEDMKKKKKKKTVEEHDEWHVPEDLRGHFKTIDEVVSAVAAEVNKSADEVAKIVTTLSKHRYLLFIEDKHAVDNEVLVQSYLDMGATVGETAVTTARKKIDDDYYPLLFGDDEGFENHRLELIKRLVEDTKAQVQDGAKANAMFMRTEDRLKDAVPEDVLNNAEVDTNQLGRFKFAFRDLQKKDEQPTMIRTRTGKWRQATPLEEAQRSWVRNPSKVQMEVYADRVKKFEDPDRDEKAARQLILDKTARRKAQLAEAK